MKRKIVFSVKLQTERSLPRHYTKTGFQSNLDLGPATRGIRTDPAQEHADNPL